MPVDSSPGLWIERAARRHPQRIAVISERAELSYAALYDRVGSLAAYYYKRGLVPGRSLAVISQNPECLVLALHLSLYVGATLLLLDPRRKAALSLLRNLAITRVFDDCGKACSLSDNIKVLPKLSTNVAVDSRSIPPTPMCTDEVQLVIATSGTSGTVKGVMLSPFNLAASVLASRQRLSLEPGDVWLACLPIFHIGGVAIVLRCLQAGASLLLHERFDPCKIWLHMKAHGVTHISLVPTMLTRLLDYGADSPPPAHLRVVLVGGGALSYPLARRAVRAGWPVFPSYGMSETASQVATLCKITEDWRWGDVGPPLPGLQLTIVDERGCPTREKGRIRISGANVMMGYANAAGVQGMGLEDGAFTSNDLGFIDHNGHLHVLGRADEMLICGGENVFPQEIEAELLQCPGVDEVAVSALHDAAWGHRLVALVAGSVTETTLRVWCENSLPRFLRPSRYIKVKSLPVNRLGKLDRRTLRDWVQS